MTRAQNLADLIDQQAQWRAGRAVKHPTDERHRSSALALAGLATFVRTLSDDDPAIVDMSKVGAFTGDMFYPGERAAELISRYGFDSPTAPVRTLIDALAAACTAEAP